MMFRRFDGLLMQVHPDEEAKVRAAVTPDGATGPLLENHGPFDVVLTDDEAKAFRVERTEMVAQMAKMEPVVPPIEKLAQKLGLSVDDINDIMGRK